VGERFQRTAALDATFHMPTYARKPVMFVRGAGMRLYDDEGREYLDFLAGIGSVNLGHAHPAITAAVVGQMDRLVHVSNLFYVEHRDELARDLAGLFGHPAKVFLCNSGAESVEGAIKLARRWGKARRGEGCFRIVTAERSFHGRTLAALAATGQPSKQELYRPLPEGFDHVPLNDIAALEAAVTAGTCAVMLEPVQGEGGVYPCDPAYLKAVRELCDERDVLLVLDEVQTGFYRTGPVFAHQAFGVLPDVMCLAKSLANGLLSAGRSRLDLRRRARPVRGRACVRACACRGEARRERRGVGGIPAVALGRARRGHGRRARGPRCRPHERHRTARARGAGDGGGAPGARLGRQRYREPHIAYASASRVRKGGD
jgi:acetylornithine/succinyldiaminopimelate/putrescine aminotransferase